MVKFFDTVDSRYENWLHSWRAYFSFLQKYYKVAFKIDPGEKDNVRKFKVDHVEKVADFRKFLLERSLNLAVHKKANNINRISQGTTSNSGEHHCTLLLLWSEVYMHWLKVKCEEKCLDRRSIFCVNGTQNNSLSWNLHLTNTSSHTTSSSLFLPVASQIRSTKVCAVPEGASCLKR